jgi:hypothetical protein
VHGPDGPISELTHQLPARGDHPELGGAIEGGRELPRTSDVLTLAAGELVGIAR